MTEMRRYRIARVFPFAALRGSLDRVRDASLRSA